MKDFYDVTKEDVMDTLKSQRELEEKVEKVENDFRKACVDMVEMCFSPEKMIEIVNEEYGKFPKTKFRTR